jgi:hypothetical protein
VNDDQRLMTEGKRPPTPHASVNAFVAELLRLLNTQLGDELVGLYVDGSLALGDFDEHSDVDFVAVTRRPIAQQAFERLQTMHDELARLDSPWATQHEGSYLSLHELRRYDPAHASHPNIERGNGERLKWATHDTTWNVHRYILRERGIVIKGPPPRSLLDPIDFDELRAHMKRCMLDWPGVLVQYSHLPISSRGYQSYIVLTVCRMLCTIERGEICSKLAAANWAQETLHEPWSELIAHAWIGRSQADAPADPAIVALTRAFISFALERSHAS